jgi:hypothetical protein
MNSKRDFDVGDYISSNVFYGNIYSSKYIYIYVLTVLNIQILTIVQIFKKTVSTYDGYYITGQVNRYP